MRSNAPARRAWLRSASGSRRYFAMAFSAVVELLNTRLRRKRGLSHAK